MINKEISAEMLLGYLYPDDVNRLWNVSCKGTFYRNYNNDYLSFNPKTRKLELARDGFLKTLPNGMLHGEDELTGSTDRRERFEDLQWEDTLQKEAFSPFDSFTFRHSLLLEKTIGELLSYKTEYILKSYYDIDLSKEPDPMVRDFAKLLPMLHSRRGNADLTKLILSDMLHCDVELDLSHRYSDDESDKAWMPYAIYTLIIPGLTATEYQEKIKSLEPLKHFIQDRLIPFDVVFELRIRDRRNADEDIPARILDYNYQIK